MVEEEAAAGRWATGAVVVGATAALGFLKEDRKSSSSMLSAESGMVGTTGG